MLLPWGLSTLFSCVKLSFLDLIPHHLEICLNVTFLIRSFLRIQYPPASLSPYPFLSITFIIFKYILLVSPRPHHEGRNYLFCSLLYPQPWESAWHLIVLKYLNEWMGEIYFYSLRIVAFQPLHFIVHLSNNISKVHDQGYLPRDLGFPSPYLAAFSRPLGSWSEGQILCQHLLSPFSFALL